MWSRILMEKTLMEEGFEWSTREAVVEVEDATVVDVATSEVVEIATGVDLVEGGLLAPGLDIAFVLRTCPPQPPGRISRTSCVKQEKSTIPTLIRTGVERELPSLGRVATWSMLSTSWMARSLEAEGSGSLKKAREEVVVVAEAVEGLAPGPGRVPAQGGGRVGPALAPGPAQSLATGPGDLETRIAPGPVPGLEPGGQEAAAAPKDDVKFWQPGNMGRQKAAWILFSVTNHKVALEP